MCLGIIFLIHKYKKDLELNNPQWLIFHKTKRDQTIYISYACIKKILHKITYNVWYAIKPNQTKSYIFKKYV